jgi:hypothetical protein
MKHLVESDPKPYMELQVSEHGTYTIFDLPSSKMEAAERIVSKLRAQAFMVRFLQGEDRPQGMHSPYGIWPHPDSVAIEMMTQEVEMPVYTSEELAALGHAALTTAA